MPSKERIEYDVRQVFFLLDGHQSDLSLLTNISMLTKTHNSFHSIFFYDQFFQFYHFV
jgi:hypothetical protein